MSKTVLVVDDFNSTRQVIQSILEKSGHIALLAESGKDALKFLDGRDIDLLLTDLNMPDMNGIELTKAIRKSEKYYKIPVIMLTTETKEPKLQEAHDAGITGMLKKPFDSKEFMNVINRALR